MTPIGLKHWNKHSAIFSKNNIIIFSLNVNACDTK